MLGECLREGTICATGVVQEERRERRVFGLLFVARFGSRRRVDRRLSLCFSALRRLSRGSRRCVDQGCHRMLRGLSRVSTLLGRADGN